MAEPRFSWTDVEDLAILLQERHPEVDPYAVRFTDLRQMVEALPEFDAGGKRVNEAILEAIQAAWIEEREDAADDED